VTLAILTGVVGAPSETFVARHVRELRPGSTVVVGRRVAPDATWSHDGPMLLLDGLGDEWWGDVERGALCRFLDEHRVTAVLAEFLDLWTGFVDALTAGRRRVVVHAHGYDVSQRLRDPWWREAYGAWTAADAVVTMSQVSRQRLIELGLPGERVHVVPYGVDVPDAPPAPRSTAAPRRALAVGRLVPKKDPLTTLEALRRARQQGAEVELDVIGDGPLRAAAHDVATGHRLPVVFRGAQPNAAVRAAMSTSHLFLQHSRTDPETGDEEGLPVAVLEAMASGLPVIATKHAGIPEAVEHGVTGVLVDEGDAEAMAAAIVRLDSDPDLRAAMGAAGWRRARARFTHDREREALLALL
jgi:colanic acid/amylovoran biosynthesis glycosyltransferase